MLGKVKNITAALLPFLAVFLFLLNAQKAHAAGYQYYRAITVTSTLTTASGTQTNFPLLLDIASSSYLQSTSTGGKVYNAQGYDITFSTSTNCANGLNFITEAYASSTGQLIAQVSVPTPSAGSVIYMCYGNPSITSAQASSSITGDSSLVGYWPLNEGAGTVATTIRGTTSRGLGAGQRRGRVVTTRLAK